MSIQEDDEGIVFFATRAPGQVAAQTPSGASTFRGARSGNSNFDPASGRFAAKGGRSVDDDRNNPVATSNNGLPQGVTPEEWDRRRDAVRDAAREYELVTPESIAGFLESRVTDSSQIDVEAFVRDVRLQRLDDLTDVLAQKLMRGRNVVSLKTTRAWPRNAIAACTDQEIIAVLQRLSGRGFSTKDIKSKIVRKLVAEDRRTQIEQVFGEES